MPPRVRLFIRDDGRLHAQRTTRDFGASRAFARARVRALTASPRAFLEGLFRTAVAAAHPESCLPAHLPAPPSGRLVILAAGKAAGSMAEVAERHYLDERGVPASRIGGLAVTRHGYGRPTPPRARRRGGPPDARRGRSCRDRRDARARRFRRRRGSGAGAHFRRRLGKLDRARCRPFACGEAGSDARAARLRRLDRRDQHRAQASLPHQRRAAGAARVSRRAWSRSAFPTCRATIRR